MDEFEGQTEGEGEHPEHVPAHLLELFEVLEWEAALAEQDDFG